MRFFENLCNNPPANTACTSFGRRRAGWWEAVCARPLPIPPRRIEPVEITSGQSKLSDLVIDDKTL